MIVLIALCVFVNVFHPRFLGITSIANMSQQAAFYGLIALGMVFMLSMGEIDLSVGGNFAFSAMTAALLAEQAWNPWIAGLAAIVVGGLLGALNAVVSNVLRLPLIIVTLGSLSMYRGLTLVISSGEAHAAPASSAGSSYFTIFGGTVLGLPAATIAFVVATGAVWVLYRRTRFGFAVRAIGSNPQAAKLSGYPIGRIRLQVALLIGSLCGLSAAVSFGFFQSSDPNLGTGYELQVIAAAVIGGTALSGGKGNVVGAFIGALIISVINGALTAFGVSVNWTSFVTGAVIIGAVAIDSVIKRRQSPVLQRPV
ncbi:MAG: ABC transporter permease [Actinobacteria bacterium]|nr:ABC transporter permease [Actinomycetota bacterium]